LTLTKSFGLEFICVCSRLPGRSVRKWGGIRGHIRLARILDFRF